MMTPIRFSSTIRVVAHEKFPMPKAYFLEKSGMYAGSPFNYQNRVRLKPEGMTMGAYNCNAGGIQNGDSLSLFHLDTAGLFSSTDERKLEETGDALENDIRQLKKENPNLRAVLSGGAAQHPESQDLKYFLLGIFRKWQIPTSIIWGADGTDIHYDTKTDTWTISAIGLEPTLKDFKKRFPEVHIDPGDELVIGGRKFNPEDVNTV